SDCRDCSRSCAILVTSPYRPQRTTKALAIRCVIVDMGLPPSMPIGVNSPTIEHISREIVHRLPPESPPLEKVPKCHLAAGTEVDPSCPYPERAAVCRTEAHKTIPSAGPSRHVSKSTASARSIVRRH